MRLLVWLACLALVGCSQCGRPAPEGAPPVLDAAVLGMGAESVPPPAPLTDAGPAPAAAPDAAQPGAEALPEETLPEEGGEALAEEGGAMGHRSYRAFLRTARDCLASTDPACVIELVAEDASAPRGFPPQGEAARSIIRGCLQHLVAQRYERVLVRGEARGTACMLSGPEWRVTALQLGTGREGTPLPRGDVPSTAAETLARNDPAFRAFLERARACRTVRGRDCLPGLLADTVTAEQADGGRPLRAGELAGAAESVLLACLRNVDGRDFLRLEVAGPSEGTRCVFARTPRGWKLTALDVPD